MMVDESSRKDSSIEVGNNNVSRLHYIQFGRNLCVNDGNNKLVPRVLLSMTENGQHEEKLELSSTWSPDNGYIFYDCVVIV
jgi:hypothetical protein